MIWGSNSAGKQAPFLPAKRRVDNREPALLA